MPNAHKRASKRASNTRMVQFMECKNWGHAWDEYAGKNGEIPAGVFDWYHLRCTRCTTTRAEYLDRNGDRIGGLRYVHPEGYKDARDTKPSRAVMRLLMHGHSIPRTAQ